MNVQYRILKTTSIGFKGFLIGLIALLAFSVKVEASPGLFSYQGRILNTQGQPLQSPNVAFEFTITSPDGACVIYKEQRSGVDMRNSNGLFDVPIGSGVRSFPTGPSATLLSAFDNTIVHACNVSGTYTPVFDDIRRLRVAFYDGVGWSLISPDITIRSVPYAGFANTALNANKLSGKAVTDFVAKEAMPLATCSPTEVITFDGTKFVCVTDAGGSAGTITSVAGTAPIVVTGTTALTISATVGTGANTLAAGNDSRFTDMRVPTDNSVTSAKIVDATIQVGDLAPGSADGQVFRFQSGNWTHSKLRYTDLINGNNASPWPTATCVAGEYITWVSVLDGFACTAFSSSAITTALGYTPANRAITITAGTGLTGGTVDLSANRTFAVDVGTTDGKIPQLGVGGKLPASMLPATIADGVWEASGGNVYRSAGSVGIGTSTPGYPLTLRSTDAQGLAFENSSSGNKQWRIAGDGNDLAFAESGIGYSMTLKAGGKVGIGTSAPASNLEVRSTGDTSIKAVKTGQVGFVITAKTGEVEQNIDGASSEFLTWKFAGAERARMTSTGRFGIGTTSPTEMLDVVGKIKGTELCIGNVCHSTWPSGGGGTGTVTSITAGTGLSGGTITDNGTIAIATGGVDTTRLADGAVTPAKLETVAGLTATTYGSATEIPAITVDNKGRVTAATTHAVTGLLPATGGATGKFLKSDTPSWENILMGDIKNATGVSVLTTTVCDANEAMSWSSVSNTFICQVIGSLDGSKITTGTIDAARLPSSITDGAWSASGSNAYRNSGNVGIGTSSPGYKLDVNGAVNATGLKINGVDIVSGATNIDGLSDGKAAGNYLYLGDQAGANSTGSNNTGVGAGAIGGTGNGGSNSALGFHALWSNTSGLQNTAVGASALSNNTTGNNNIAIGKDALRDNTAGSGNTVVGDEAFRANTGGFANTVVGVAAASSSASRSYSTIVGAYAGSTVAGDNNVIIGASSGTHATNTARNSNILIGYDVQTPGANTDNFLNIGNTLYGNLSTGNVGIKTTSPTYPLHVVGTTTYAIFGQNTGTSGGVRGSADSGIGVYGVGNSGAGVHGLSTSGTGVYGSSTSNSGVSGYSAGYVGLYGNSVTGHGIRALSTSGTAGYFTTTSGYAGVFMGGNVGIGTLAPKAKLEVEGQIVSKHSSVASGATVDFANGNLQTLESVGGSAITLQNIVHGGNYTLVIRDTTARTYTFAGCNTSYFNPTNGSTLAGTRSVYTILAVANGASTECYISWITGFN